MKNILQVYNVTLDTNFRYKLWIQTLDTNFTGGDISLQYTVVPQF